MTVYRNHCMIVEDINASMEAELRVLFNKSILIKIKEFLLIISGSFGSIMDENRNNRNKKSLL